MWDQRATEQLIPQANGITTAEYPTNNTHSNVLTVAISTQDLTKQLPLKKRYFYPERPDM